MNSTEVDQLVMSYLMESGYSHTCFSLAHESSTCVPSPSGSSSPNSQSIPPGHLIRILHKGLLYLEAEARFRGETTNPPPRLVGYAIPDSLPVPPIPSAPPAARRVAPAPSGPTQPSSSTSEPTQIAPPPSLSAVKDLKGKGKQKEGSPSSFSVASSSSKRKGSDRSDREDSVATNGKRPKVVEGPSSVGSATNKEERKKKKEKLDRKDKERERARREETNGDEEEEMSVEEDLPPKKDKLKANARRDSPAASLGSAGRRSTSPAVSRKAVKNGDKSHSTESTAKSKTLTAGSASSSRATTPNPPSKPKSAEAISTSSQAPTKTSSSFDPKAKAKANGNSSATATASTKDSSRQQQIAAVKQEQSDKPAPSLSPIDLTKTKLLTPTATSVIRLRGHTQPKVQPCSWNPKVPALLATGGGDSTCRIWDVPSQTSDGKEGKVFEDHIVCKHSSALRRADVACVQWNSSGSLLATGSEDAVARIFTPEGDLALVLSMHQRAIVALAWNPSGTMLLTASLDGSVCLWELSNGKVKQQWTTHSDGVTSLDWLDDNCFASGSSDQAIHLLNPNRTSPVHRFKGHKDDVNQVAFAPCGTLLASCSDDSTVRIWSLRNIPALPIEHKIQPRDEDRLIDDEEVGGCFVLKGHSAETHAIAWAPPKPPGEGPRLLASASFDQTAKLWNADDGTLLHTFTRHSEEVYSLSFSPLDGAFLATGSNDGKMCVWDVKTRKLVQEYEHAGPVYEIAWQVGGRKIAVCGGTEDVAAVAVELVEE